MRVVEYNKLVRDNFPDMIRALGVSSDIELVRGDNFLKNIYETMDITLADYHKKLSINELVDLIELVYTAAKARGYSEEQFDTLRQSTRKEYGSYDKGFKLLVVYEKDE